MVIGESAWCHHLHPPSHHDLGEDHASFPRGVHSVNRDAAGQAAQDLSLLLVRALLYDGGGFTRGQLEGMGNYFNTVVYCWWRWIFANTLGDEEGVEQKEAVAMRAGGVARGMQRDRHPPNPTRQQERDKDNMFSRTEGLVGRCFSTRGGPIYKVSLGLYHGPEFVPSAAGSTAGTGQGRGGRRWGQKEEAEAVVIDSRPGIIIPCLNSCSLVFVHPFVFPDTTDKAAGQRDEEEEEGGCGGIQG